MKTRSGFVSNSSSSSFVVAFGDIPRSKEELQAMMFSPGETELPCGYYCENCGHSGYSVSDVVDAVWRDMQEPATDDDDIDGSGPLNEKQIGTVFASGHIDGTPELDYRNYPDIQEDPDGWRAHWDAECAKRDEYAHSSADEFTKANEGCSFFRFHYSDNDGAFWSQMEHGDIFRKLPHFQISHH